MQSLAPRHFTEFRNSETYYFAFLNLCCFAPVFIFAVYYSIYYLLPKTLARKRYAWFLFDLLLLYAAGMAVNYFMAGLFLRHVHYSTPVTVNFEHQMEFGAYNTRWGMVIAIIALGIKLTKSWYLQLNENLEMLKKQNRAELQLQKSRLHSAFLLRSLHTIYTHIQERSGKAPALIIALSDLLSYSLYETGKQPVPLERELEQLKNFIGIEQVGTDVELDIQTTDSVQTLYITPLTLIKLLEDIIASARTREPEIWLKDVRIIEANNDFSVAAAFSKDPKARAYENE